MKYYFFKLLTQCGVKELEYCDKNSIEDFIADIIEKYGKFVHLSTDEFEGVVYDKAYHLQEGDEIEYKPALTTYYIFRKYADLGFEVTHTGEGRIKSANFTLNELFLSIRVGFSNTEFK